MYYAGAGGVGTVDPTNANLHTLIGGRKGAVVIDVVLPPYCDRCVCATRAHVTPSSRSAPTWRSEGRVCTYYRVHPLPREAAEGAAGVARGGAGGGGGGAGSDAKAGESGVGVVCLMQPIEVRPSGMRAFPAVCP